MKEKWDGASLLGGVVVATIFGCLSITIGGGWKTIASAEGQTWAAWFQAIGSVAAIFAAVWLHQRGNREASERAKGHAVIFRAGLTDALMAAYYAADERNRGQLHDCLFVLSDVSHLGQSIQLERLDDYSMIQVSQWRSTAAKAQSLLEQWKTQPISSVSDYLAIKREFGALFNIVVKGVPPPAKRPGML